jgi:hypothetical protein
LQGLVRGGAVASGFFSTVLGTANTVPESWRTPRTLAYYLGFDPRALVQAPYATGGRVGSQEPTYWNQLLKSSLFGTRNASLLRLETEPTRLAVVMNVLAFVALLFLVGVQLLKGDRPSSSRVFAIVATLVFVGGGLGFHLLVPYAFHADFRFIYPVIVPLSVLYAEGTARAGERSRALRGAGYALASSMLLLSVVYFVPFTWNQRPRRVIVTPAESPISAPPPSAGPRLLGLLPVF